MVNDARRRGGIARILVAPRDAPLNRFVSSFADALVVGGRAVNNLDWRLAPMLGSDLMVVHWPEPFFNLRQLPRALALLARIALARARGSHLVWVVHNLVPHSGGRSSPAAALFMRSLDGAIFLSASSQAAALERYPVLARARHLVTVHGSYTPIAPATPFVRVADGKAARLLAFGLLRRYKNLEALIEAAAGQPRGRTMLSIVGYCADSGYAAELRAAADTDAQVDARATPLTDDEIEAEIDAADMIVLPYRAILNSGAALHALSRNRPVVLPRLAVTEELRAQVGAAWVYLYEGAFDATALTGALDWLMTPRDAAPDLTMFGWDRVAADLDAFCDDF